MMHPSCDENIKQFEEYPKLVYNNLISGSYNHLRAFTNVLTRQTGEVYQPQYLSADAYQSIVTGSMDNGNGNRGKP